ncbi:DNA-damage-inducible protein D [Candidatus Symbiothrix dinenymphae]|nr:DNA-damage-inducible protein D [Candidatus Symbiothrix dinenymphae]
MEYAEYRNFISVVERAKESCKTASQVLLDHFVASNEVIIVGKGAERQVDSIKLSRYDNLFRATQTEEKLRRANIYGKQNANQTHFEVGKKVRQTIKELGGTMPEELPTTDSIKKLERRKKNIENILLIEK